MSTDEEFKTRVLTELTKTSTRVEDIQTDVKALKTLPERMSLLEKDNHHVNENVTKLAKKIDDHINDDAGFMRSIKKWLMILSIAVGVLAVAVFGVEKTIGWVIKIFGV